MVNQEKEMSVPVPSVGADEGRTHYYDEKSIAETGIEGNNKIALSLDITSLDEVLDTYFEPKEPIIENFLYPGTAILAGASKIGKSFLVAEIAFCIATGKNFWNEKYKTTKGEVLYLALEDDLQRIQTRFSKMFGTEGSPSLHFATASKTIEEGLMMQLTEYITKYPKTKLIIIDTLQKIRGLSNENVSYSRDYDAITQLKNMSDKYGICILIVHHTRKQDADDCFEKISGTNGIMGSADAAIIMTRKRGTTEARLQITGRDQQEQIINMAQDQGTLLWNYADSETTLWTEPADEDIEKIRAFMDDKESWSGTASELITDVCLADVAANALTRKLNSKAGILWNEHGISYRTKRTNQSRLIVLEKKR